MNDFCGDMADVMKTLDYENIWPDKTFSGVEMHLFSIQINNKWVCTYMILQLDTE